MTNMKNVNAEQWLNQCNDRDNVNPTNIDPVPEECTDDGFPTQKRVSRNPVNDWSERPTFKKIGPPQPVGQQANCDPFMTGQIINDTDTPNRQFIYRYSRALRGADEAMFDLFRNIFVIDEEGKQHIVPLIWASQEKAVASLLQDNVRKDNSLVVDRIRLPLMSIYSNNQQFDQTRFTYQKAFSLFKWNDPLRETGFHLQEKFPRDTIFGVTRGVPIDKSYILYVWTLYQEDMNQILEQVLLKFSPVAYIRVRGVWWEIIVTLDSQANNLDIEPGDKKLRVVKYQFEMTAKTYIPQPITRIKDVSTISPDPKLPSEEGQGNVGQELNFDLDNPSEKDLDYLIKALEARRNEVRETVK